MKPVLNIAALSFFCFYISYGVPDTIELLRYKILGYPKKGSLENNEGTQLGITVALPKQWQQEAREALQNCGVKNPQEILLDGIINYEDKQTIMFVYDDGIYINMEHPWMGLAKKYKQPDLTNTYRRWCFYHEAVHITDRHYSPIAGELRADLKGLLAMDAAGHSAEIDHYIKHIFTCGYTHHYPYLTNKELVVYGLAALEQQRKNEKINIERRIKNIIKQRKKPNYTRLLNKKVNKLVQNGTISLPKTKKTSALVYYFIPCYSLFILLCVPMYQCLVLCAHKQVANTS